MSDTYARRDAAFRGITAYYLTVPPASLLNACGFSDARLAFKRSSGGAVTAFLQIFGDNGGDLVIGSAGGGGYDKHSAAVMKAVDKLPPGPLRDHFTGPDIVRNDWRRAFERLGCTVVQVI